MTSPKIWKASEICLDNMVFTKKTKSVSVTYLNKPLYLQSPKLEYNLPMKWDRLRLSLYLKASDKIFSPLFQQLDQYIPELAYKMRKEWFDESLWDGDPDLFRENYRRQVMHDTTKNLDCIRFNILDTEKIIYNEQNQLLDEVGDPIQELAFSKYNIVVLLKCRGIWVVEESFGLSWDVIQLKLYKPKTCLPLGSHQITYSDIKDHHAKEVKIQAKNNLVGIDMTSNNIPLESDPLKDEPVINYLMRDD